ncbi:MAG: anthranilate phosphoribosyltransferase [Bacteroidota bacterium]
MKAESLNSLEKGIRFIGIGKHGSKDLPVSLVSDLLVDLQSGDFNPIQQGAFFGALVTKGVAPHEYSLENYLGSEVLSNAERLFDRICEEAPAEMKLIGVKLLQGACLSETEARQLGNFILSDQPGEVLRGMAVSILRVRYESDEEYHGLMLAINDTFTAGFRQPVVAHAPLIQLAEPFDGVEHSYIITPILANALQKLGYAAVSTVGRSSGPKLTMNAWQLYQSLAGKFIKSNEALKSPPPPLGWVLDQKDLSPALDRWVDRRRAVIKRPFLATLEKALNPTGAKVLITSVFHLTYMEKMVELGMMAGFEGVIVLKRGLEGTLAPSIARASGILCAARQPDGTWTSTRIEADSSEFSQFRAEADAIIENPDVQENARLVQQFLEDGLTGNRDFDLRAGLAVGLYSRGLLWIEGVWQS